MAAMVMPMRMRPNNLEFRRRAASMNGLAARRFKLNRRMRNMKPVAQSTIDAGEYVATLRHRHLGNRNVARQSMRLRAQAPHMQVVNIQNAFDRSHRLTDLTQLKIAWRPFQQNVQRLTNNPHRAPQNHSRNQNRKHWIDPGHAAEQDRGAARD